MACQSGGKIVQSPMEQVAQLIAQHEGLRLKPYKCTAGKITIGYGRNLDDNGISKQEAEAMLVKDISGVYTDLSRYEWFYGLDEVRAAVLVDMCYNLGINRLSKFKRTMKFIELGQYLEASLEMLNSKWAKQVGNRAVTLSNMMKTGKWYKR